MAQTTDQIQQEINKVLSELSKKRTQLTTARSNQAASVARLKVLQQEQDKCAKLVLASKRKDCTTKAETPKIEEKAKLSGYNAAIANLTKEIAALEATKNVLDSNLQSAQSADNEVRQTLAKNNETIESVQARAMGEAQATLTKATIEAETEASNKKKSKNMQLLIIFAVAAVVIGIGTIVLIAKVKKKRA